MRYYKDSGCGIMLMYNKNNNTTRYLLSRDDFREKVFERDNHRCIVPAPGHKGICGKPAVDAHHIIERRLWQDPAEFGGYFIDNGASVCEEHHIAAEKNFFPPQYFWQILGVTDPIRPKSFAPDVDYNKWGDAFKMPKRYRTKYPTTPYLPFSPQWRSPDTAKDDEAFLENVDSFLGSPLVLTTKMDGSNVQFDNSHIAARNGTAAPHKSFDYLKALYAQKYQPLVPEGIEVFGEWLYAKHSIHYTGPLALKSYLQIFGVYDMNRRMWGSWDDVEDMATTLSVPTTPVLKMTSYEKEWQLVSDVTNIAQMVIDHGHEGVVVRIAYPFHFGQFFDHIAKIVRPNHVQTDKHWSETIVRNLCL